MQCRAKIFTSKLNGLFTQGYGMTKIKQCITMKWKDSTLQIKHRIVYHTFVFNQLNLIPQKKLQCNKFHEKFSQ